MSFPVPSSLSPSKVSAFKSCALAFRFSAVERLPEPASPWTVKGTLVHRALELLFWEHPQGQRSAETAAHCLDTAWLELQHDEEFVSLAMPIDQAESMRADATKLIDNYFELEDPNSIHTIGVELRLEVQIGSLLLRGIIDRLDLDENGDIVVVDYKTGRAPSQAFENGRMGGVQFYSYLCEQVLGRRPAKISLLHLAEPVAIVSTPTEQSTRGLEQRTRAVWQAVERACTNEDFRPKPSALCGFCSFKSYCPAFGGDPARAAVELGATRTAEPVEVAVPA